MGIQSRRERERAERHRLIIETARELAETEGWDAVTVRRLADRIEYSQPVLYSHFADKNAIVTAVAEDGIGELAAAMGRARAACSTPSTALAAVAGAYSDFAAEKPALYDAMFAMTTDLKFGPDAPSRYATRSPNWSPYSRLSPAATTWRPSPKPAGASCTVSPPSNAAAACAPASASSAWRSCGAGSSGPDPAREYRAPISPSVPRSRRGPRSPTARSPA